MTREVRKTALGVLAALLLLGLGHAALASAHGIRRIHYEQTATVIETAFSDGTTASFAQVLIYAPGGGDTEFQNGRTDARGRFAFLPDRPGVWRVKVDAGMGHGFDMEIEVPPESCMP
ncbi:hypothetical protein [Paucidesulfovibrio longus]|uniref:hypothetical protein n=1 Tax=Paucidesulfovibrio longus TaxID=889 RepID=UPI0003B52FDD|nr:hypothetical protein [Paucidesulfovibrio longus]